jgi:histidine triad (HIT) family protein
MADCIFCKIVKGELPCSKVYEDDKTFAFLDISPVNPGHALVIPKTHCRNILDMSEEDVAAVYTTAKKVAVAVKEGTGAGGITVTMSNEKAAGQVVWHAHVHVIPRFDNDGFKLWPGKPYKEGQQEEMLKRISERLK